MASPWYTQAITLSTRIISRHNNASRHARSAVPLPGALSLLRLSVTLLKPYSLAMLVALHARRGCIGRLPHAQCRYHVTLVSMLAMVSQTAAAPRARCRICVCMLSPMPLLSMRTFAATGFTPHAARPARARASLLVFLARARLTKLAVAYHLRSMSKGE